MRGKRPSKNPLQPTHYRAADLLGQRSKNIKNIMIEDPKAQWLEFLKGAYRRLVAHEPLTFGTITPSQIPETPGVYLITAISDTVEIPYYIGRSTNLRQRIYNNHLMGPLANARLKKYLIDARECSDISAAKAFIKTKCLVRWIEEPDVRTRGAIEGYVTGLLFPKYGIYEEH